jgi:hypothetical protein
MFFCFSADAQEKLSNAFSFTNGLYRSYEEFRDDRPSVSWQEVTSDLVVMEPVHRAKMKDLMTEDGDTLDISGFWGFCVNGIPYIRVTEDGGMHVFSGLRLRGRICYLEYQITVPKEVEVSAYNPQTGKPFRTMTVTREETIDIRQLMDFETGKEAPYNAANVRRWIASDTQLLATFEDTSHEDKALKLFKFVQIFNDRNPVLMND